MMTASPASADVRDEARTLAREGIAELQAGAPEAALAKLQQAEAKFHAPTHLLYIGRAQRALGRLVAAHRTLVRVMREPILPDAPPAFERAKRDAVVEATDLAAKVPSLDIEVTGGEAPVSVTVDGEVVSAALLAFPVAVAAGTHEVKATDGAGRTARRIVEAPAPGATLPVTLDLEPPAVVPSPPPSPSAPPSAPGPRADEGAGSGDFPVFGTLLLSLGGAGLIGGAVTGALTLGEADDIKSSCDGNSCPPELEAEADDARRLGDVSTGLFIAGGVVAAAGITVLIIELSGSDDDAGGAPEVALHLRPGGVVFHGRF
ncbi:MAG: hypothetical protein AAGN82_07875 [Myxococcota bacterium]